MTKKMSLTGCSLSYTVMVNTKTKTNTNTLTHMYTIYRHLYIQCWVQRLLQGSIGEQQGGILESFISAFSSQIFTLWQEAIKVIGWDSLLWPEKARHFIFCTIKLRCTIQVTPRCNFLTCLPQSACIGGERSDCWNFWASSEFCPALHWSEHFLKWAKCINLF